MGNKRVHTRNLNNEREYVILLKRTHDNASAPRRGHPGDAGHDLYVSKTITIPPGEFRDVSTDICVCFPDNIWGRITGRSSTLRDLKVLVMEGILDNGYRGELKIGAYNLSNIEEITLTQGMRIAQLILHDLITVRFKVTEELPISNRGSDGFGSTGR